MPTPFSWTGLYVGAHVGIQSDRSEERGYTASSGICFYTFGGCIDRSQTATGVIGGLQIGYNFQSGMFVYGVETDISLSSAKKNYTDPNTAQAETGVETFGTVRGRIGYLFRPDTQVYATGGLAYAKLRNRFDQDGAGGTYTWSKTDWATGWILGGGIEHMLTDRIAVRGEALYYDLGTENRQSFAGGAPDSLHDKTTGWIARIALNYFFH
jgi:outer membrane immunogenic protein